MEVFPVIDSEIEAINEIGVGLNELVFKFQGSLYKGRFFYINTSDSGEKIGSGDPDIYNTTTYIENADLDLIHCQIHFNTDTSEYFLADCSTTQDTWIKILPNILEKSRLYPNSTIKIGDFTIKTSNYEILSTNSDFSLLFYPEFQNLFTNYSDILNLDINSLHLDPIEKNKLQSNIDIIKALSDTFPILHLTQGENDYLLTPRGLTIGTQSNSDIQISSDIDIDITILFSHQEYFLCFNTELPVYYKLIPAEEYKIQSGDCLKLGKLEFLVSRFNVGRWSHQGKRQSMEDADVIVYNLFIYEELPFSYFAVYDGHGGKSCSEFLKSHLHQHLRQKILNSPTRLTDVINTLKSCIIETFKEIDSKYAETFPDLSQTCGSASIICIVFGDRILTINLGDSRAVLCRKGIAIDLSTDHKPTLQSEQERIIMCGGSVTLGRIDSILAVSRAFGDFNYKNGRQGNLVEIQPELTQIFINPIEDEFLILGCDGLFEAYTSQSLVDIIRKRLVEMPPTEQNPNRVIREIINEAIFEGRTNDNVTALLVNLNSSINF